MSQDNHLEDILKGRFIQRVFADAAIDINKAQVTYINKAGFKNPNWNSARSFVTSESALNYSQLLKHRFVDMKRIRGKKRRPHPIYNKIIWGHYNNIIREMAFGFTDAVKEQLKTMQD